MDRKAVTVLLERYTNARVVTESSTAAREVLEIATEAGRELASRPGPAWGTSPAASSRTHAALRS